MTDEERVPISTEILLLSDSTALAQLITVQLRHKWEIQTELVDRLRRQSPKLEGQVKLIILALCQPGNEPVVVLYRTNTIRFVGQIPCLIISLTSPQGEDWPEDRIWYRNLPPDLRQLSQTVSEILSADGPRLSPQAQA